MRHSSRSGRACRGVGKRFLPPAPDTGFLSADTCCTLASEVVGPRVSFLFIFYPRDSVATAVSKPTRWTRKAQKRHISGRSPSTHKARLLDLRLGRRPPPPHGVPRPRATLPTGVPGPPPPPHPPGRVLPWALALLSIYNRLEAES